MGFKRVAAEQRRRYTDFVEIPFRITKDNVVSSRIIEVHGPSSYGLCILGFGYCSAVLSWEPHGKWRVNE
jgi:hypothetical protein